MVFPMHFSWAPTSLQALLASPEMARLREKITLPSHPGEKFLYFQKQETLNIPSNRGKLFVFPCLKEIKNLQTAFPTVSKTASF